MTVLRRLEGFEQMWSVAAKIAQDRHLPERTTGPIVEAAYGIRIRRATYLNNVEITWGQRVTELTASRDLKALVTAGLLLPLGDTRARRYVGSDDLKAQWAAVRKSRPISEDDPFVV